MQPFLEAKREEIAELCRTHHVRRLAVFGSAVRDDFDPATSDVDFLVDFDEVPVEQYADNKFDLEDKLADQVQRKIDLLTRKYVSNPYMLRAIERDQVVIFGS